MADNTVRFPALVVSVLNNYRLVINRGQSDNIKLGQRMLVYELSDNPVVDPETGESLGHIELVKGTGKIVHVQERLSTIESDRYGQSDSFIRRPKPWEIDSGPEEVRRPAPLVPFDSPKAGDKVKPI